MAFDLLLYICQVTKTKQFKVRRILKTWMYYCEDPERSCEYLNSSRLFVTYELHTLYWPPTASTAASGIKMGHHNHCPVLRFSSFAPR